MSRIAFRQRSIITSLVGACILAYFLYHMVEGDRGWFTLQRKQREVAESEAVLSQLQQRRETLERRTRLLRPTTLDLDLLEEKSRELLNFSKPNEIVILNTPDQAAILDKSLPQRSK